MILGIGIDLVETARIAALRERYGARFEHRLFTEDERTYCQSCPTPVLSFAARFAAKEALVKALGTGFSRGISWTDIAVARRDGQRPVLELTGRAQEIFLEMGGRTVHLSLSHTALYATAMVVVEG